MNEQIKLLAEQADEYADNKIQMPGEYHPDWHDTRDEKFAELIVRQCAAITSNTNLEDVDGGDSAVLGAAREQILKHFGIEE